MAATMAPSCEADLGPLERAIRHLVGERAAENRTIHRYQADLKLVEARAHEAKRPTKAPPTPEFPHGDRFPDISSFQPHMDLAQVGRASDIKVGKLVVFKATEATDYTDGFFVARFTDAKGAKIPHRGAYHFLHMDISGKEQADYFLRECDRAGGLTAQDIAIADAEITNGQNPSTVANVVGEFGSEVAKHTPAKRWLYTGGPFAKENGLVLAPYDAHWLPAYVSDPRPYYVFGAPIAWQYTDGSYGPIPHACPGIGTCDMSIIL